MTEQLTHTHTHRHLSACSSEGGSQKGPICQRELARENPEGESELASLWALSRGLSRACPADVSLGPSLPPGHFPVAPSSEADVLFGSSGLKGPRSLFSRACPPEPQAQPPHRQEWGKWRSQLESPGAAGGTDAWPPPPPGGREEQEWKTPCTVGLLPATLGSC